MSRNRKPKRNTLAERLRESEAEVCDLRGLVTERNKQITELRASLSVHQIELGQVLKANEPAQAELAAARAKVDELQRELSAMNVERTNEKTRANKLARQLEALLNKHIGLSNEGL
jgi:septal ring factor EnvC (AmiA/AmiB activator)